MRKLTAVIIAFCDMVGTVLRMNGFSGIVLTPQILLDINCVDLVTAIAFATRPDLGFETISSYPFVMIPRNLSAWTERNYQVSSEERYLIDDIKCFCDPEVIKSEILANFGDTGNKYPLIGVFLTNEFKSHEVAAAAVDGVPFRHQGAIPSSTRVRITTWGRDCSDVRNTIGKDKQTPQGSARTTSAVDLEEFCEKHYEKLLPIMADKYEHERRKKEKPKEVKASPRRHRRSHSPRQSSSVFTRLKRERLRSPRHNQKNKARRESNVFERLGSRGRSVSAYSNSRQENSRYTEKHSESEDNRGGHWKSKSQKQKPSIEDDDLSKP
ncbi:hypothetical protein Tco_1216388 [Tanacetum coccineum]